MIAIESITKLSTSVVFLASTREPSLPGPGLLVGADPVELNQIIEAPEVGQTPDGIVLSSMRNQMRVSIEPNKLQFADQSGLEPARDDFPDRVARAAEYIGKASNHVFTAVGLNFNIESTGSQEELPSQAILNRLVGEGPLDGTGYHAIGASVRLWYFARERRHDLRIEPRGSQVDAQDYFAQLNVHVVLGGDAPSTNWLSQAIDEEYDDFKKVLTTVLESRGTQSP